ncbi:MAG TPA: PIG-L family deacetylase [Gemmatimonadales bacterium]|nr:PIG-L family deacetylase [Gemmatimonadales bacterium]
MLRRSLLQFLALPCFLFPSSLPAQLEPPSTGGLTALDQELRMLGHYRRVLMIGAHPDDEDTELLTVLVRGWGAEAAYLSLNRGEGGQNLIGPELGPALGLIRTEELLAARRLDGARQYFTRAYDFGYSKTLDETWSHWPRDTILKDVVRIVRRFRPQVVVSVFSGTPRDGHGQHQAAGWAAREAFRAAGDSTLFPDLEREEGLRAWTPLKLYRSTRFDSAATTLVLEGGVLDPSVGKSYHQIAMEGRSLHRSQDMGQLQRIGPSAVRLALVEDRTGGAGGGLFDGIDTSIAAMPWRSAPDTADDGRAHFAARVDSARALLGPGTLPAVAALLARARGDLEPLQADARVQVLFWTPEQTDQRRHADQAAAIAHGLVGDAVAEDDRVIGGQRVAVAAAVWNGGADSLAVSAHLQPLTGWIVEGDTLPGARLAPGAVERQTMTLVPPPDGGGPDPYFLRRPLQGGTYDWSDTSPRERGEPFDPASAPALLLSSVTGGRSTREVTFRLSDQAYGEIRRPVTIVPRVDVKLDPGIDLWSTLAPRPHRFTVTLTHGARDTTSGTVRLELPSGWPAMPARRFRFTREDEQERFTFEVPAPKGLTEGSVEIRAVARETSGREYTAGVFTVDYPHIRPRSFTRPAAAAVRAAPLALPVLGRVGYVRGASDRVPEALRRAGVPIEPLDAAGLESGSLARYDAIVIGPRAYETEIALVENNARLLEYVRGGGLLIVQYQQHQFFSGGFAPYPMTVGGPALLPEEEAPASGSVGEAAPDQRPVSHDRVTDETAPVRVLAAEHPAMLRPNRIEAGDWEGWVQERGLYFARSWAPAYRPILETHDPGEVPLEGGLLVATVGKGTYVYTGLSFFRQLPAGVPGAFRLFANLLALRPPRAP